MLMKFIFYLRINRKSLVYNYRDYFQKFGDFPEIRGDKKHFSDHTNTSPVTPGHTYRSGGAVLSIPESSESSRPLSPSSAQPGATLRVVPVLLPLRRRPVPDSAGNIGREAAGRGHVGVRRRHTSS